MARPSKTTKSSLALEGARSLSPRRCGLRRQADFLRGQFTPPRPRLALSVGIAVAGAAAGVLTRRRCQAAAQQEPAPPADSSVNGWIALPRDYSVIPGDAGPDPATPLAPAASASVDGGPPNESAPGHEFAPAPDPGTTSAEGDPDAPNESAPGHHPDATGTA